MKCTFNTDSHVLRLKRLPGRLSQRSNSTLIKPGTRGQPLEHGFTMVQQNHDGMMAPINNKRALNMIKQGAFYLRVNSESAIKKPSSAEHI